VNLPILYSFRRCPYAIRARLALCQAGVAVEIREILLRVKPAELLAVSAKATVPVLVLPDASVIDQSLEIMHWALARNDPSGWLAAADPAGQQALIDLNDGPFKALLDRYKYPQRHPGRSADSYRDEALEQVLMSLEQRLAGSPFLFGPRCSLADMALLPFIRQFAAVDAAWFDGVAPLPRLNAWRQRLLATPLFLGVMEKRPVWTATAS
jgi:glutathione S-transferase